ncbi:hypothetical protein ACMD2_07804 [Ananas comosus]|uniref:UV radiation resistance protein/autophagy-related protein 14 n=1 Tax=Ananas comosus TaxID=4615 RepID=A0A199V336_ANACO|nr:hypothetical protein ACMD2_07804 [Ananas comosus]
MARRSGTNCGFCERSNLASVCSICVNHRLNEYNLMLNPLRTRRESLYARLREELEAKKRADDQLNWRVSQNEKIKKLRDQLTNKKKQLSQEKAKLEELSNDLKLRYQLLNSASATLEKNRAEFSKYYTDFIYTQGLGHMAINSQRLHIQVVVIKQICKLFPIRRVNLDGEKKDGYKGPHDQICNARLPRALDPHSVPSEELAASLGYMLHLLNVIIPILAAPSLHNAGFAGSSSRIWQRETYWIPRSLSQSNEYPLFIPRQNFCSSGGENSWSDKSSSNFGVASVESEKKSFLGAERSGSFNYSFASQHSMETHKDLQKGISLLKKSVACITAYCYNSLGLEVPSEASTFEVFARLLATLTSSRERRSAFSLKQAWSRSNKQVQQLNRSVWNINSGISSSSSLMDSMRTTIMPNFSDNILSNSTASFLYTPEMAEYGKSESLVAEDWDIIEHPTLPPPPSQSEDVEHWTRAMFIDATKK